VLSPYPWQDRQWRQLLSALEQDRLPHALLLAGADGLGVGHFARALAARLLCTGGTGEEACGACKSCLLFAAGNHPDLVIIGPEEAGKAIKVEAVRELVEFIHLSSQYGRHKVAIIEPAEAMNRSTANSLLKTLEEPTPASVLILCSRQPAQLPVTIRSRCQRLNFTGGDDEDTRAWLAGQLTDGGRARELLSLAGGRPLAALQLEQEASLEKQAALLDGLIAVADGTRDPVSTAREWAGLGAAQVLQWLLEFIRIMIRAGLTRRPAPADNPLQPRLEQMSRGRNTLQLLEWYAIVFRSYRAATGPFNLNPQGLLEEIIVHWQALSQSVQEETQ
jgi:DNA polymerase-3 subunit delta'